MKITHASESAGLQVKLQQDHPIPLDVNLTCEPGELLALTGPSGSGKTTVLRAIAGLQRLFNARIKSSGDTWCDTEQRLWLRPQQRRVGLVFQQYALFPHLSALANVCSAMLHVPRTQRAARARHWLALTNMEGLEQRRPHELSGGQRQRVALARALAREPSVLLLDEPFSAVDQQTRQRLFRELVQLRRGLQHPVLLVTHDMQEVQQLADTLCLIHRGTTLQSGPLASVMHTPDSCEVARLLGHRNLYTGTVVRGKHRQGHLELFGQLLIANTSNFRDGSTVDVMVAGSAVMLHRQDRPSQGERENPLPGVVAELTPLGDNLWIRLETIPTRESLCFELSRHVAARNGVAIGIALRVSLLVEGIHLMPPPNFYHPRSG